jgi:hypothetical protein
MTAAAFVIYIATCLRFFNYIEDDAFIYARVAWMFVHGHGWVFNPGEAVNCATGPLMLWVVTALSYFWTYNTSIFILKVVGVAIGVASLALTLDISSRAFPQIPLVGPLAILFCALRPQFALSTINCLETPFALLFVTGGTACVLRGRYLPGAALCSLAALCRPEMSATFLVLIAVSRAIGRRPPYLSVALNIFPMVLNAVLQYRLYGTVLPNTYYAKHASISQGLATGLPYMEQFLLPPTSGSIVAKQLVSSQLPHAGLLAVMGGALAALMTLRESKLGLLVLAPVFTHVAAISLTFGDWMADGRFAMVVFPVAAVAWSVAVVRTTATALSQFSAAHLRPRLAYVAPVSLFGALFLRTSTADIAAAADELSLLGIADVVNDTSLDRWSRVGTYSPINAWISQNLKPRDAIVFGDLGVVGYVNTAIRIIDVSGLSDPHIARMNYPRDVFGVQFPQSDLLDKSSEVGRYIASQRLAVIFTRGWWGPNAYFSYHAYFNKVNHTVWYWNQPT